MKNMSQFQIVLLGAFCFFTVVGVIFFATFKGGGSTDIPVVTLWGTYPQGLIRNFVDTEAVRATKVKINYVEKDPATLDRDFVEALASGRGPDLVLLPQNLLEKERGKLAQIPFKTFPEREFKDTFIEGGELFLTNTGTYGIPFSVDPLIMYWNRTLFSNAGVAAPPKTWDEFGPLTAKLTSKETNSTVKQSTVALGTYQNITNAKELLSALFLQAGSGITTLDSEGKLTAVFKNEAVNKDGSTPSGSVVSFYTAYSDPAKSVYSWNSSLNSSARSFIDGTLATYMGFGSELSSIRKRNPNLNFDVATLPQVKDSRQRLTYGNFTAFVFPKQSKNTAAAYQVARLLTSAAAAKAFADLSGMPPVRRDLLSTTPAEAYTSVLYTSALMSKAWRDPSPTATDALFGSLIQSVVSGSNTIDEALRNAGDEMTDIISSLDVGNN
jgi:ABC-type glycerol-3-phosphate transport system substrate-binding protein